VAELASLKGTGPKQLEESLPECKWETKFIPEIYYSEE
jgi:hypothetical protein